MKPIQDDHDHGDVPENNSQVTGDVIGETAYSERFVLKILLKLANLDTLKDELTEKSFEEDLCTLWDMTAERDVVVYLQKHDVLNLFQFALPNIDSQRVLEIIIGIIGNMCCVDEVVTKVLNMDALMTLLISYITSDDSLILVQVLRLFNYCILLCQPAQLPILLELFKSDGYSCALYFILKNSLNKNVLIQALENFNTLCNECNNENTRKEFYEQFVSEDAIMALSCAFNEITLNQRDAFQSYEFERMLVICLQIILNLVGFSQSSEMYRNCTGEIKQIIQFMLIYNESILVELNVIDPGLEDIVDSINTITSVLKIGDAYDEESFHAVYNIWKTVKSYKTNSSSDFEINHSDDEKLSNHLCLFMCKYIEVCDDNKLLTALDKINDNYDEILLGCSIKEIQSAVTKRTNSYRSRINENVDS